MSSINESKTEGRKTTFLQHQCRVGVSDNRPKCNRRHLSAKRLLPTQSKSGATIRNIKLKTTPASLSPQPQFTVWLLSNGYFYYVFSFKTITQRHSYYSDSFHYSQCCYVNSLQSNQLHSSASRSAEPGRSAYLPVAHPFFFSFLFGFEHLGTKPTLLETRHIPKWIHIFESFLIKQESAGRSLFARLRRPSRESTRANQKVLKSSFISA